MNYRCCHFVPHLRAISVQLREIFVMVTKLKELILVDFRCYLLRNDEYCNLYGVALITREE